MPVVDTHCHIFGPYDRFPLPANANYRPEEAVLEEYLRICGEIGIEKSVVVQGSCYGTDNALVLDSIARLGMDHARGVVIIDDSFSLEDLIDLDRCGVRGIRVNAISDASVDEDLLERRAGQIASLGWHIVFHCNRHQLERYAQALERLPVEVIIDHLGRLDPDEGLGQPGMQALCRLLESEHAWVKLITYRSAFGSNADTMRPFVQRLLDIAPERCVWGTDWPHPLMDFQSGTRDLHDLIHRWLPSEDVRRKVLSENALRLYWNR